MNPFPPLDTHAHIDVNIDPRELLATRAVILVATRSLAEYGATLGRSDPLAIWGVGVHPGVRSAVEAFDSDSLRTHLRRSVLLSEVGLDRRSAVALVDQKRVFASALAIHDEASCIASVHSAGRTREVLEMLNGHRCETIVLHWWRGSPDETRSAVELGCYFSFNPRDDRPGSVLDLVPAERRLTETDHPYGDADHVGSRPGSIDAVEQRMTGAGPAAVRRQIWSNFRQLIDNAGAMEKLPGKIAGLVSLVERNS